MINLKQPFQKTTTFKQIQIIYVKHVFADKEPLKCYVTQCAVGVYGSAQITVTKMYVPTPLALRGSGVFNFQKKCLHNPKINIVI